jgi:hypothetical protein
MRKGMIYSVIPGEVDSCLVKSPAIHLEGQVSHKSIKEAESICLQP